MALDITQGVGASDCRLSLASAPVTTFPVSMFCWFNIHALISAAPRRLIQVQRPNGFDSFSLQITGASPFANQSIAAAKEQAGFLLASAYSATTYSANVWTAAGATWASNVSSFAYKNGVPGTIDTTNYVPNASLINTTYLGTAFDGVEFFGGYTGCLAKCAIWFAALTDQEHALLATGIDPQTIQNSSLVFYAPLLSDATKTVNTVGSSLTATAGSGAFSDCATSPPEPPPSRRYTAMIGPIRAGSGVTPTPIVSSSYFGGEFDSYFGDYLR